MLLKSMYGNESTKAQKMKRGRVEIIAHILAFCMQPRLKTQILYNANVSFRQFETYATFLESQGLLIKKFPRYVASEKGHRFVQSFIQLQCTLEGAPTGVLTSGLFFRVKQKETEDEGANQR